MEIKGELFYAHCFQKNWKSVYKMDFQFTIACSTNLHTSTSTQYINFKVNEFESMGFLCQATTTSGIFYQQHCSVKFDASSQGTPGFFGTGMGGVQTQLITTFNSCSADTSSCFSKASFNTAYFNWDPQLNTQLDIHSQTIKQLNFTTVK